MRDNSLSFYSNDLEREFQAQNMQINLRVFAKNIFSYGCSALSLAIYALYFQYWVIGALCLAYIIQVPLIYLYSSKGPQHFDFACFAFQISLSFGCSLAYFFNVVDGPIADCQTYLIEVSNLIKRSCNLGSQFYLKALAILINIFPQMFIKLVMQKDFSPLTFLFMVSNFMVVNYLYWQDRIKREAFLTKHNEKQWQTEMGECAQISILTCLSKKGQLILDVNKCNQTLQEVFKVHSSDTLKDFLNNVKLIDKKYFSVRNLDNNQQQYKSKNKRTCSLHSWINRFSEQTQSDNSEFIGLYDSCLYDTKIFTTWNDQFLNIHTLMTKSLINPECQSESIIKYERELFSNFRKNFAHQIKTLIIQLKRFSLTRSPQLGSHIMTQAYDALRLNYNLQLYINPQFELYQSEFLLWPMIKEINKIVMFKMPYPYKLDIDCLMDTNMKLKSCKKTIYHIVFNLYSIIIRYAKQSGSIKISVQQKSTSAGSIVKFSISTNITSLKSLKEGQNHHRNNYGKISLKLIEEKKYGLEIVVSEYLIGKLGPIRKLQMVNSYNTQPMLAFTLYQDLSVLNDY